MKGIGQEPVRLAPSTAPHAKANGHSGEQALIGKVNIRSIARVAGYHGACDELHIAFDFLPLDAGQALISKPEET